MWQRSKFLLNYIISSLGDGFLIGDNNEVGTHARKNHSKSELVRIVFAIMNVQGETVKSAI